MVVLHQDEGRLLPGDLLQQGVGELLVHLPVMGPVLQAEVGAGVGDVAERPQPLVREPVIVAVLFLLGQPYPLQGVGRFPGRHAELVVAVDRFTVRIAASVRDPEAVADPHHGIERGDQPARGDDATDARAVLLVHVRLPVRYEVQFFPAELRAHVVPQAVGRPGGFRTGEQAGSLFGLCPRDSEALRHPARFRDQGNQRRVHLREIGGLGGPGFPRAQVPHPFRDLGDRTGDAPAHHDQRDRDDQHEQDQEADEVVPPDLCEPDVDERGVVIERKDTDRLFPRGEGIGVEVGPPVPGADEPASRPSLRKHVDDLGGGSGDLRLEVRGRGQKLATGVVYRNPKESIAVSEPLNEAIQFLRGIRRYQRGDGFLETFGQDDGPPLQIRRQADPFLPDLVQGERDGHKGDHENEGNDEAERYFHRCSPARFRARRSLPPGR